MVVMPTEDIEKISDQYLNSHSSNFFEIYAIEFNYFSNKEEKILIPQIFGIAEKTKTSEGRRIWTEKEVLEDCENKNDREPGVEVMWRGIKRQNY